MKRAGCIALCLIAAACDRAPPDDAGSAPEASQSTAAPEARTSSEQGPALRDDRAEVVDLVRAAAAADLHAEVVLDVRRFAVSDRWAFLTATARTPAGAPIDRRAKHSARFVADGNVNDGLCALAERRDGTWILVRMVIGSMDAPYAAWPEKYGVPRELLFGEE
jgi:hypothetical protein